MSTYRNLVFYDKDNNDAGRQYSVHGVLRHCRFLRSYFGPCIFLNKCSFETADFLSSYWLDTVLSKPLRQPCDDNKIKVEAFIE